MKYGDLQDSWDNINPIKLGGGTLVKIRICPTIKFSLKINYI